MFTTRQSGLEVVGSFWYLHEADLAKALLESEGIPAWLLDEHAVRTRWPLAGALGGVKVGVAAEHAERARALLSADHAGALAEVAEQSLPPHPDERCPACGAAADFARSVQTTPRPLQWLVSLFFLALGLVVPRKPFTTERSCAACGHRWSERSVR